MLQEGQRARARGTRHHEHGYEHQGRNAVALRARHGGDEEQLHERGRGERFQNSFPPGDDSLPPSSPPGGVGGLKNPPLRSRPHFTRTGATNLRLALKWWSYRSC